MCTALLGAVTKFSSFRLATKYEKRSRNFALFVIFISTHLPMLGCLIRKTLTNNMAHSANPGRQNPHCMGSCTDTSPTPFNNKGGVVVGWMAGGVVKNSGNNLPLSHFHMQHIPTKRLLSADIGRQCTRHYNTCSRYTESRKHGRKTEQGEHIGEGPAPIKTTANKAWAYSNIFIIFIQQWKQSSWQGNKPFHVPMPNENYPPLLLLPFPISFLLFPFSFFFFFLPYFLLFASFSQSFFPVLLSSSSTFSTSDCFSFSCLTFLFSISSYYCFSFSCLTFLFSIFFFVLLFFFFQPYFLILPSFSSSYCFSFSCLTFLFSIFFFVLLFSFSCLTFLSYFLFFVLLFFFFFLLVVCRIQRQRDIVTKFQFLPKVIRNLNAFSYGFEWEKGEDLALFYSLHQWYAAVCMLNI